MSRPKCLRNDAHTRMAQYALVAQSATGLSRHLSGADRVSGVAKHLRYATLKCEPVWVQRNCQILVDSRSPGECRGSIQRRDKRAYLHWIHTQFKSVNGLLGGVTLPSTPFLFSAK